MRTRSVLRPAFLITALSLLFLFALPVMSGGPFVEPDVRVIHELFPDDEGAASGVYGWVGAEIGDIDYDGAGDYILTAPFYSVTHASQGKAYIHSGISGAIIHEITGTEGVQLGYSAAGAGDVDGDGTPDYILSGPGMPGVPGSVRLYSGADHGTIWTREATGAFGADVAGGFDLNRDGTPDVLVGASFYSGDLAQQGQFLALSGVDGTTLWTREGLAEGDSLGAGVGVVGDVNNDGVPDVTTSSRFANDQNGEAYVFSGSDGTTLLILRPEPPFNQSQTFGQFFASGAGDVNNDGTQDVFIGDYNAMGGSGRAYVYSGEDGSVLYLFEAENTGDGLGPGRGVGDINGDGYDDIFVAAYTYSGEEAAPAAGKGYLYSGVDGSLLRSATGTNAFYYLGVDALTVGDVTADGVQDYLLTGYGTPSFVISFEEETTALHLEGFRTLYQGYHWPVLLSLFLLTATGLAALQTSRATRV